MIRFHPYITLLEAAQALDAAAMILLPDWNGGALIVRRADAARLRGPENRAAALRDAAARVAVNDPIHPEDPDHGTP